MRVVATSAHGRSTREAIFYLDTDEHATMLANVDNGTWSIEGIVSYLLTTDVVTLAHMRAALDP